ncbi:MAG TPA: dephospho-CoA kinase [Candidatus Acidoferrum sp.]|jgi:dephospho-CoA kinase
MLRYGLTGGIASGKSAVAEMLREMEFPVLEADRVAHRVMEPGQPAYDEVVSVFGEKILNDDKRVNRGRLAAIVFADREKLNQLNAIIHPRVEEEIERRFKELTLEGKYSAAFVEAALIFEAGLHKNLDGVLVAWCQPEQQLARLIERGMSEADATKRMAAQMPVSEKLALGTVKIDCSGTLVETRRQVELLAAKLRGS